MDLLILLHIQKLAKIIGVYENLINMRDTLKGIYNLLKLVSTIIYVAHCTACFFYYIAYEESEKGNLNFLSFYDIIKLEWYK